jgi:hypothetical protein
MTAETAPDMRFIDISWVDRPLIGFARILVTCPECGQTHRTGEHPDDGCPMGVVHNVMVT